MANWTATWSCSLDVESSNHTPVSTNQQVVVVVNSSVHIPLAVTDADNDPLNCPILKGPQHGLLSGLGTNFTYTPKPASWAATPLPIRLGTGTSTAAGHRVGDGRAGRAAASFLSI